MLNEYVNFSQKTVRDAGQLDHNHDLEYLRVKSSYLLGAA